MGLKCVNAEQKWFVDIKQTALNSHCSGCLAKNITKKDDIHLYVSGLHKLKCQGKISEAKLRLV